MLFKIFSPSELELSIPEVCQKTGMSRATAYRMISAFVEELLLEKNPETNKYGPGRALFQIGMLYLSRTNITNAAGPIIKIMNELCGENVNVTIFEKDNIVVLLKEEANHEFRLANRVGTCVPAYACASGRAFLSEMSNTEIERLYPNEELKPLTPKTIATKTELKRELELIRESGISIDREGPWEGVEGIGSLVRNAAGESVAAICITIPVFRVNQENRERIAELIKRGTAIVSYRLGYHGTQDTICNIENLRSWWVCSQKNPIPVESHDS